MRIRSWTMGVSILGGVVALAFSSGAAGAELLTADRAVKIALETSSQAVVAEASVVDARANLLGAYSGILPHVSLGYTRGGSWINHTEGNSVLGTESFPFNTYNTEGYLTTPTARANWNVLDFSAISGFRSAGKSVQSAESQRISARNDIALEVKRQFYLVVQAIQLARVNTEALKLSRDDERRVRALFDVGSVSRSDVLRAQVRTAQSELDSLTSGHQVTVQRIALAAALGIREQTMGEVDTVLTNDVRDFDEASLLAEAERNRPDIQAADAEMRAAADAVRSAKLLRVPYVSLAGDISFDLKSNTKQEEDIGGGVRVEQSQSRKSYRDIGAAISLNWNIFDGLATDSRIAAARARHMRAKERSEALHRNLESEVRQQYLAFREVIEGNRVADRAVESAEENFKLTQQKYNVGSATILDLIDAQVQFQRARSQQVTALAAIRVAEASLDRVLGRSVE